MRYQITAETHTKAPRESHCSATAWSSWPQDVRKEHMSFPPSCTSSLCPCSHAVPQTPTTNLPNLSLFPLVSLPPIEKCYNQQLPSQRPSSPLVAPAPLSGDPLQMTASGNPGAAEKGHNLPLNKETSSLLKLFPPSVRPHRAILPLNAKVSPIPLQREGGKEREQRKKRHGVAGGDTH